MTSEPHPGSPPAEDELIFNVVWTGEVFPLLKYFVLSQMAHTTARFRFIANWCPAEQISLMEEFRRDHPDQVVEVLDVSPDAMVSHGESLERARSIRDDGDWFCFIDPDIKANSPWVADLVAPLDSADVVTAGKEVWSDDSLVPEGGVGVAGEHFFGRDGFVFGSPHLAVYRRAALDDTSRRWNVRLQSAGPDLSEAAKARLTELGQDYLVFDTAKLVNTLVQADGYRLVHHELAQLVHIGGLSHFVSPAYYLPNADGELEPEWTRWGGDQINARHNVARFTAATLRAALAGEPTPPVTPSADASTSQKLDHVLAEVTDLAARYGPLSAPPTLRH